MKHQTISIRNDNGTEVLAQAPLIVSASRATDIPAFYADWFFHRIEKGYVRWRNPFSGHDSYVSFDNTRFIVFWSKDVYDWCAKRHGQENIVGFQVHLDESSPHIHTLIVPVGQRTKSGRECVMRSAKFGKNRYEYGRILREMHTSLYEEVGSKYGLERGDSIEGRHVSHLNKRDYIR